MKKFTPYVSIDLETTGLSMDSDILEIAAIYDDGGPLEELKKFHRIVKYKNFKHAEPYAVAMNAELIKESFKIGTNITDALLEFDLWLDTIRFNQGISMPRLYVAGKNVAGFDIPMLENNYKYYVPIVNDRNITKNFTHRTLDVGSMYFPYFGENVTLGKINELTGRAANVSHRAMDDAMDVVIAIRHLMKNVV